MVVSGFLNSNPTGTKGAHYPACQSAYPSEMRSDIVALMDPGQSEPGPRIARGAESSRRGWCAVAGAIVSGGGVGDLESR